jgi:hypothetical protein
MKHVPRLALCAVLFVGCYGCAHTGNGDPDALSERNRRIRNTLIAVGTAVVVGAVLANQAQSNTRDAIRDGAPQY